MKFDELYYKLLGETNLAGGAGVLGIAAGDGDMSTGWTGPGDIYAAMSVFGSGTKKRKKKRRKKARKKKIKKMGEDGMIAYSKGPTQAGSGLSMQKRPAIGRM